MVSFLSTSIAAAHHLRRHGLHLRTVRRALLLAGSFRRHISVLRVLSHPQTACLARKYPSLAFKYLVDYVALGLPAATRRSIFVEHFQFLQRKFSQGFLESVDGSPMTVWREILDDRTLDVVISLNGLMEAEGDLLLIFRMDGVMVYRMVFVFASGRDFHLPDETVILVSAVQGVPDFDRVRLATRMCRNIQPAHLLMAALGALAEVTGVSTILGLHQSRQLYSDRVRFSYDKFFEIYGTEIPGQRTYRIQVPYAEKPISMIETSHRKRTLRKRQFKADARRQVVQALTGNLA